MFTFVEYRRAYQATRARLEAEYCRLPLQEKSRRVLGHENHLLYSSQAVTAQMSSPSLSSLTIERGVEQQLWQFESMASRALVCVPCPRRPAAF
jgi:hypothetical protein